MLTQQEYQVLVKRNRELSIKIGMINESDNIVASLQGIAIGGSVTLDATSNYRRTGSLEVLLDARYNLIPAVDSLIWLNKRVKIEVGLKDLIGDIVWFDLGRFSISELNLTKDLSGCKLAITLLDYMAFLDGTLSGTLISKVILPAGLQIDSSIRDIVQDLAKVSVENILIEDSPTLIPYDIEKAAGATNYDLIKELSECYKNYEFYFDSSGFFIHEQIRYKLNDPIVWNFDEIKISLTYDSRFSFSNVKNVIYVWGKLLESGPQTGTQIVWVYKNRYSRATNSLMQLIAVHDIGDICHVINDNLSYWWNGTTWTLLDFTVFPGFNIETIGEREAVISNDKIFDLIQAELNARFELKRTSSFAETLNFTCIPIYGLKPNQKIKIIINEFNIDTDYLIKNITFPLTITDSSSVQCEKIYY